jgi:very-short-patch-repair endonuclease
MVSFHETIQEQGELSTAIRKDDIPRLPKSPDKLADAARLHGETIAHIDLATTCADSWRGVLRIRFRVAIEGKHDDAVLAALGELRAEIAKLEAAAQEFVATSVALPDAWQSDATVRQAITRASQGKSPLGLRGVFPSASKKALSSITVNGKKPGSAVDWQVVERYCKLLEAEDAATHRWNKLAGSLRLPMVEASVGARIAIFSEHGEAIGQVEMLGVNYDSTLRSRVEAIFPDIRRDIITHDISFLTRLEESLRRQLRHAALAAAQQTVASLRKDLEKSHGPIFSFASQWLIESLGAPQEESGEITKTWTMFAAEVSRLHDLRPAFQTISTSVAKLHKAGAETWAGSLATKPVIGDGPDTLTPQNWHAAWLWSQKRGFLERIDGRAQILHLSKERREAESRLQREYEQAIEKRTWLELVEKLRLDQRISRAITAYAQAIRNMTKSGKGKRDVKLRHAAREAMHLASGGVPCWIMPHWRVSEALPPSLGSFDLVVIDEASQSDAWAIPAILRAKKVLIVGDDKQVGPQPSFTRQEQVNQIQERMRLLGLSTHVRHRLDPKESIYDLGELVFSGQTIRLREHFRCAEAIIEFSNKLCYDNEIKCVRVPTADERLLPTLVDVHVRNGFRDPMYAINRPEADAIVEEVARIVGDPAMQGRTIGVVSLLGHEQGKLIFDLLLERIGEEAFLKHKIRCGDARTFQGSEADIVFISAVDDPRSGGVMTENKLENVRRINVAVSRAKDRLYFYHSFAPEDLSPLDLRLKLVEHFKSPVKGLPSEKGRELCESEFEREMFDGLVQRGYRVLPQVRAGAYRIDLVVEGHQGKRLAIECDGDMYHGPEKWMDDYRRQRLLERAGWKFWRCWGSSFARDKQGVLDELVETLKAHNIESLGSADVDFTGLVEFRTHQQQLEKTPDLELADGHAEDEN